MEPCRGGAIPEDYCLLLEICVQEEVMSVWLKEKELLQGDGRSSAITWSIGKESKAVLKGRGCKCEAAH